MAFISIKGLKRQYKMGQDVVVALNELNLDVDEGEFLCLMGPSGSGKSTLLNLLGGLDSPDAGSIVVNGQEVTKMDADGLARYRQRQVGFIFQSFNLIPTMTAVQNVEFPMVFAGVSPAERHARAVELLQQVGLGERLNHKPTEMSGGQQQRVAVARGLVNKPDILDSKTGEDIMGMLTDINTRGQTVIVVTHDPKISTYAKRTIRMLDGHVVDDKYSG